jgi:hypothetical protein
VTKQKRRHERARAPTTLETKTQPTPPPLHSFNELEYRWVALDTWNFTRKFDVPADLLSHSNVRFLEKGRGG